MTICMILDDDEIARLAAAKIVADVGLIPLSMNDSETALRYCQEATPDIIILDIMMPKVDGLAFLKSLRKLQGGFRSYVIACTARNDVETVNKMNNAGVNDYVIKPFEPQLLMKKLKDSGMA